MGSLSRFRKAPHAKTYGLEYEFFFVTPENARFDYGYRGMFYATTDVSISASSVILQHYSDRIYTVELISQPLPYNWLIREIKKLEKFPHEILANSSCGIHVHVSRKLTSEKRMMKLLAFLKTLNSAQSRALFGRAYNEYCSPSRSTDSKYSIINFLHSQSFEFRMFASGDPAWAAECVRRTRLMVEYRGEYSYSNFTKLFSKESDNAR